MWGFKEKQEGLCRDPSVGQAGSEQLPVLYLSISEAARLVSAFTLVSGFFLYMHFFARVVCGVGLSAQSVAH